MDVLVVRFGVVLASCLPFRIEQLFKFRIGYAVIERVSDTAFLSKFYDILDSVMRMSNACCDLSQAVVFTAKLENCFVVHHVIDLLDM